MKDQIICQAGDIEVLTLSSMNVSSDNAIDERRELGVITLSKEVLDDLRLVLEDPDALPNSPTFHNRSTLTSLKKFLKNAELKPLPDIEIFPLSGDLKDPNECLYYKPSSNELGVTRLPIGQHTFQAIAQDRHYCRAAIRTSDFGLLCSAEEPLRVCDFQGTRFEIPQECFREMLETVKRDSPYGYEVDYSSLIEYIAFSKDSLYLGTGYYGPLYKTLLTGILSKKPSFEKVADCDMFEDLAVENNIVSYAGEQDVFVIRGDQRVIWEVDDTVYRLFRIVGNNFIRLVAITEHGLRIRDLDITKMSWLGESENFTCKGYLQSFSFLHNGILAVEEAAGDFVFADLIEGSVERCRSDSFGAIASRDHFNQVFFEAEKRLILSLEAGTFIAESGS